MSLSKELIFLILQFCEEEDFQKTAHMLEHETGMFFNMNYFECLVLGGEWDEAEKYLSGFTKVEDDKYSKKIYFEIRKQKFLEALDKHDRAKALDILLSDLKVFRPSNEELYMEMAQLLTLDDFRTNVSLSSYGDTASARKLMMNELKQIIRANPLFHDKLEFPQIHKSRLRRLINQSLNWQHIHCAYPQPVPDIETLFMDHQCRVPNHPRDQLVENNSMPSASISASVEKSTSSSSDVIQTVISDGTINIDASTHEDFDGVYDSKNNVSETLNEKVLAQSLPSEKHNSCISSCVDLPRTIGQVLNSGSSPTSMAFHPVQQTSLLVGTDVGDVQMWEVISGVKLFSRKFSVWNVNAISIESFKDLAKEPCVSVNKVSWSPDDSLFGVAYSKCIVQLCSHDGGSNIRVLLDIDAHGGGVNDLAFSKPEEQLLMITCGDDKLIKAWDAKTGAKQFIFEGHGAPVYSVCSHVKEGIHFFFSTSTNGEIKGWLFDNIGQRFTYYAPRNCCMRMAYSADGKRLFSCGTNKDGESHLVEWNETEGFVSRTYAELAKFSSGVVQFDTCNNQFLVAGDDHKIKFWDVDNVLVLATVDVDGSLPATPYIHFNKNGTLLAVSATHNRIKILATESGLRLLQTSENHSGVVSESLSKIGNGADSVVAEHNDIIEIQKFCDIKDPSQCESLMLPSDVKTNKISRLIYTNAGNAVLALASNGVHYFWKWSKNSSSLSYKANAKVFPQLWQPRSGSLMTNDLTGINLETVSPCFALSKNDSYVVSASGGTVSLFNLITFKRMKTFMTPPPAATCIAFDHRDNNIMAIGMDDSSILIYNARFDEVVERLEGHSKRISGLAFSNVLNALISSGTDSQVVVWNSSTWDKERSKMLDISVAWQPSLQSEVHVQFHQNQTDFLVVQETQLAIYETTKLECMKQWTTEKIGGRITNGTFSSDGKSIYSCFRDGTVLVFSSSDLIPRRWIYPSAYLPSNIINLSSQIYPLVIAANPRDPNQFALGLTNGGVVVVLPLDSEGTWGVS